MVTRCGCSNAADGLPSDAAAMFAVGNPGAYLAGVPLLRITFSLLNLQEIPNPKPQIPNKSKAQNRNDQNMCSSVLDFLLWLFGFVWDLGFGIWDFVHQGLSRQRPHPRPSWTFPQAAHLHHFWRPRRLPPAQRVRPTLGTRAGFHRLPFVNRVRCRRFPRTMAAFTRNLPLEHKAPDYEMGLRLAQDGSRYENVHRHHALNT